MDTIVAPRLEGPAAGMGQGTLLDDLPGHHVWNVSYAPGLGSNHRLARCARCGARQDLWRTWAGDGFTFETLPQMEGCPCA